MAETASEAAIMASTAGKFDSANDDLQTMLSSLLSELEMLQTSWVGRAGSSFEQVKIAWSQDQKALHQALAETSKAIRTAGQEYSRADEEQAGRVASKNTGGVSLNL
ncbi:type VII secretion system ESX-1 WXG100 family target CFP-10 [Catellatospora coxensis]|jgi:WXG100 family type VII secretion target|uniref:ESAT-6-like protein n=2 Tax=Catellatospora TaxID=53365 RepID=A0A8J3L2B9_9ACTN|nr:ESAT-6-like protein EsxB [Catellatospora coxensis]